MGRFLNADTFVSTGQGFTGNNMFAYCNNAPVISYDNTGTDACIIVDEESAGGFGHVSIVIQDENGEWHYYSFGSARNTAITVIAALFDFSVKGSMTSKHLGSSDGYDVNDFAGMQSFLADSGANITAESMDRAIYIKGDYSKSQQTAEELSNNIPRYNLLTYNCMDFAVSVLAKSNSSSLTQSINLGVAYVLGVAPRYSYPFLDCLGEVLE